MSRLSALMTIYNEVDFVECAIRAALPYVDDLIIVEGSYLESQKVGATPRSNDGTIEIIEKLNPISLETHIHYIEANELTDKDQRNVGLEKIKELNPNGWLLIIDGDEVYTKENFVMVRNFMRTMESQNKYAARFRSLTFVNDFNHYVEQDFSRLFRITPRCKFIHDNEMVWPDVGLGWGYPHVIHLPYLQYHHYAFCKGKRFDLKKKWWESRFPDKKFEYDWYVDENGKLWSPNHEIKKYTKKHPDIMKTHPLYTKGETK